MSIRPFHRNDQSAVVALWQAAGVTVPWNDPASDIATYLASGQDAFLVATHDGEVIATAMAGYDGHRGWIYYLAVAKAHRRKGIGRALVRRSEATLRLRGCPKVNLMVRGDNASAIGFYRALGYEPSDVSTVGRRLD